MPGSRLHKTSGASFRRARWGWFVLLDGGIVLLSVLTASGDAYRWTSATVRLPPRRMLRWLLVATGVIHLAEGVVAARRASRRGLPAAKWGVQTFIVGFPSLLELRRQGQDAASR